MIDLDNVKTELEQIDARLDNIGSKNDDIRIMNRGCYHWKTEDLLGLIQTCKKYNHHLKRIHHWIENENTFYISPNFVYKNLDISITIRVEG